MNNTETSTLGVRCLELVFCLVPIQMPFRVPGKGKVNKMILIVNHSDFRVALHGVFAHGAGSALRMD